MFNPTIAQVKAWLDWLESNEYMYESKVADMLDTRTGGTADYPMFELRLANKGLEFLARDAGLFETFEAWFVDEDDELSGFEYSEEVMGWVTGDDTVMYPFYLEPVITNDFYSYAYKTEVK